MTRVFKPDSGQTLEIQDEGGSAALTVETNGDVTVDAGNVVIGTADKGIDFSQSQTPAPGVDAEILDSYEEGTFEATLTNATIGSNKTLYYTKIGRVVFIHGRINFGSDSNSGDLIFNGLPFTSSSGGGEEADHAAIGVYLQGTASAVSGYIMGKLGTGATSFTIREAGTTGTGNTVAAYVDTGTSCYITGSYVTNS